MDGAKKLLELIFSDEKLGGKLYRDEPLVFTASQMESYLPEKLAELRLLTKKYYDSRECFYYQAKLMEDYEDDVRCNNSEALSYFPYFRPYDRMTDKELRGYFTWRAAFRRGEQFALDDPPTTYLYIYIFELLHLVGAVDAADSFAKLEKLSERYPELKDLPHWLSDMAVFYELRGEEYAKFTGETRWRELSVLKKYKEHSDEEIFRAVGEAACYDISRSKFFKEYPEDSAAAVSRVYRSLAERFEKRSKKRTYFEKLFGVRLTSTYRPFATASFYTPPDLPDLEYVIAGMETYRRIKGQFYRETYSTPGKNHELYCVIRNTDKMLREKFGYKPKLQAPNINLYEAEIIEKAIDSSIEERKRRELTEIKLDLSKLSDIRASADVIREKLIIDEEEDEKELPEEQPAREEEQLLGGEEQALLRSLLYGEKFVGRGMVSVIADSVNEKLFDRFGDNVIAFDGDTPEVIEDYAEELKGMVKK